MSTDRRTINRDRRLIERFTDSRVREGMVQIRFWLRILMGLFVVMILGRIFYGVYLGTDHITSAIFDTTFLAIYVSSLFHYDRSIGVYLENGSLNSFEVTIDRQKNTWMILGILLFLLTLVQIVLRL